MNSAERKAFAETIRPAVKGKSDKFSWRLYQRALKNGREKVYLMAWSYIDGYKAPDIEMLKSGFVPAGIIALGCIDDHWFNGNRLSSICTPGAPRHDWAFTPAHHTREWIEVTDWFWSEYARKGRCLFYDCVHEWLPINRNSRKCANCGKHERRTMVTKKTIERREVWA